MSLIFALFIKLGIGHEAVYRFFEFAISSTGLVFIYLIAKEIYNKKVGIISCALLSVFYLHLFYTARLLLDSIAPTFWAISIYFFIKGYIKEKNNKYFYLAAFFGAIGVFFYNQTISLFILYLVYLFITERINLFKEKRYYIFGLVALATFIPNLILNKILFGNPVEFIRVGLTVGNVLTASYWENVKIYLSYFPVYLGTILFLAFIISLVLFAYKIILGIDLIIKSKEFEARKDLFLLLWIIIPFLLLIKIVGHFEDRYLMPIFIPIFIIIALGFDKLRIQIAKISSKNIAHAVIIILVLLISYNQILMADSIIEAKKTSFQELKEAGIFIEQNTNRGDKIIASFTPMLTYYSGRQIIHLPETEKEMYDLIKEQKPKYLIVSVFSTHPQYINKIINNPAFIGVKAYKQNDALVAAIFEIDYSRL
jgi:4-amino-4-deoxy-L-arabinose transferase-like glycosyltransferase